MLGGGRAGKVPRRLRDGKCFVRLAFRAELGHKPMQRAQFGTHMRIRFLVGLLLSLLASGMAGAQHLPNHVDPTAREIAPNLASVPSIRFLITADYPPFNYRDAKGELVGFNVDLARAICTELAVACTLQAWPWEQAANALADNQGDALLAGLALTPENGKRFDFSNIYLAFPGRFVTRKSDVNGFDPASLAGKTVAVRRGATHDAFLERYLPQAVRLEFDTEIDALAALDKGEAFAYFGDALRASFWLNQAGDCCAFAGEPYFRPDLFGEGLAAAVPAGHDTVRLAIDAALVRLERKGVFDELYLRWFPVGFY